MRDYDDLIYQKRPISTKHARMKRSDRAKQFAAFAALKGYEEAIHRQERQFTPKKLLSDSRKEELDWLLRQVQVGDVIRIVYYCDGAYDDVRGTVGKIDQTGRSIYLAGRKIAFGWIYDVEGDNLVSFVDG